MARNPFLDSSFHIKWSTLTPDQITSGIEAALANAEAALSAIRNITPEAATFENSFLALEAATEELNAAWGKVSHLSSVNDTPALREVHNALLPKVSEFYTRISLDPAIWKTIKAAVETKSVKQQQGIYRRFVEETVKDFLQNGADLPDEKKARLEKIQSELAQVTHKYSENVLDATNAWELVVDHESKLKGLPERAKEAARRNALEKGIGSKENPKWRFTLHMPSLEPLMTYADDADLRRQAWEASAAVGFAEPFSNGELVRQILRLRNEKANLLSQPHFADLILERRMAKNGRTALAFVEGLHARVLAAFKRECKELEEFKAQETGGTSGPLAPWEIGYWSEKMRQNRYSFDEEKLRPYFPMERVIDGMFQLVGKVFGLHVIENPDPAIERWHVSVKFYDLVDKSGRKLGSFYTDWYPRESKRGGAWMNYLITGGPQADGKREPHLGLMCGNMTPPMGDKPALLTHREVETVFHEFGHLLHHLLGEVAIKSMNGVNVVWDFVELPSQLMENWTWEKEALDLFARHYVTGETIPDELLGKLISAKNFRSACTTMRQLAFARMDLLLHLEPDRFLGGDLDQILQEELRDYLIPTTPPAPSIVRRFTHVFGDPVGYAAGYYSYKWAEVLDADAFTRFKKEGILNPVVGAEFMEKILSRGNSEDPMNLYISFMGREPALEALLKRAGLSEHHAA